MKYTVGSGYGYDLKCTAPTRRLKNTLNWSDYRFLKSLRDCLFTWVVFSSVLFCEGQSFTPLQSRRIHPTSSYVEVRLFPITVFTHSHSLIILIAISNFKNQPRDRVCCGFAYSTVPDLVLMAIHWSGFWIRMQAFWWYKLIMIKKISHYIFLLSRWTKLKKV